ncbi:MAG: GAF domain-containing protein [bacterium]|nr:GAF domain-containing protein [bacterium]
MLADVKGHYSSDIDAMLTASDVRQAMVAVVCAFGRILQLNRAHVVLYSPERKLLRPPVEWSDIQSDSRFDANSFRVVKEMMRLSAQQEGVFLVPNARVSPYCFDVRSDIELMSIKSLISIELRFRGQPQGALIGYQSDKMRNWKQADCDITESLAYFAGISLANALARQGSEVESVHYSQLLKDSQAIFFQLEAGYFSFLSEQAEQLFGLDPSTIATEGAFFLDYVHPEDRRELDRRFQQKDGAVESFVEEFRVACRKTGDYAWVLGRFSPVLADGSSVDGWDAVALDITARYGAEKRLVEEKKRLAALYTIAEAIRGSQGPSAVARSGIEALIGAANAECGFCFLYSDFEPNHLEMVAHSGFSDAFEERAHEMHRSANLPAYVAIHGEPLVLADVADDERTSRILIDEDLGSGLLVPILIDKGEVLGTIGVFCRERNRFGAEDLQFMQAAASQIGLAVRQAVILAAYKKQTKRLSLLYRMGQALSTNLSLEEVFHRTFRIIREELGLNRFWVGLLDNTGTHLAGHTASGPGWKKLLIRVSIDVSGDGHPLGEIIRGRKPVVMENSEELFRPYGLEKISLRMGLGRAVFIPLVTRGQVLGVLAAEIDKNSEGSTIESESELLGSIGGELAAFLRARQLEERIAEGERMRTAGLLASGIAHNFNNILQAILGQASLLELQGADIPRVSRAVSVINDAATRGAGLVKKLLSFTHQGEAQRTVLELNELVRRLESSFNEQMAKRSNDDVRLVFAYDKNRLMTHVDPRQVHQVIEILISNALEATTRGQVEVLTDSCVVGSTSSHPEVFPGSYVRVIVRDTGTGMSEETIRHCFEPFYTTKNVDPRSGIGMTGSGLGLAVAYALAKRNGARLVVESVLGSGTTFYLYLLRDVSVSISEPLIASIAVESVQGALTEDVSVPNMERQSGQSQEVQLASVPPQAQAKTTDSSGDSVAGEVVHILSTKHSPLK